MAVIVTIAYLYYTGADIDWLYGLLAAVFAVLFHLAYYSWGRISMLLATILIGVLSGYFITGMPDWSVLWAVFPVGLINNGIVHAKFSYDTLAKREEKGEEAKNTMLDAWIYGIETLFPFIWVGIISILGILPISTIAIFLTISAAIACTRTMAKSSQAGPYMIDKLYRRTTHIQLYF